LDVSVVQQVLSNVIYVILTDSFRRKAKKKSWHGEQTVFLSL